MIISRIMGGIGNQMFQYAAGKALSTHLNAEHLLDLSVFDRFEIHNGFELTRAFSMNAHLATSKDVKKVLGSRLARFLTKNMSRFSKGYVFNDTMVIEPHFNFWKGFFKIEKSAYLSGYWQSEKYFHLIEDDLRKDFLFRKSLVGENHSLSEEMIKFDSVSIHIRRGDYLSDQASRIMAQCSVEYYNESIEIIVSSLANPKFYIFSDDINWAKANLRVRYPCVFVNHNLGASSYIDMQLMSLCKHNIIANSSFSWWSAWLNRNNSKIVIAPRKWFSANYDTNDLYPDKWLVI